MTDLDAVPPFNDVTETERQSELLTIQLLLMAVLRESKRAPAYIAQTAATLDLAEEKMLNQGIERSHVLETMAAARGKLRFFQKSTSQGHD